MKRSDKMKKIPNVFKFKHVYENGEFDPTNYTAKKINNKEYEISWKKGNNTIGSEIYSIQSIQNALDKGYWIITDNISEQYIKAQDKWIDEEVKQDILRKLDDIRDYILSLK